MEEIPELATLAEVLKRFTPHDGIFELKIPGVSVIRRSQINTQLVHGVQQSTLCIVAQGAKRVILEREIYDYDTKRMIASTVDVPVTSQVTQASFGEPFLCLRLNLDPQRIAELSLKVFPHGLPRVPDVRALSVTPVDRHIINAAIRLVELVGQAKEAEMLAPLVIDEIFIRLLHSPVGARVAQMGILETGIFGVKKAISWLRANFSQPMKVEALADMARMSVSSFHKHFRLLTSMSPLQYQKALRLQEARSLMLSKVMDSNSASQRVGYVSASQFTREYGRFFGSPPNKDITTLREQMGVSSLE